MNNKEKQRKWFLSNIKFGWFILIVGIIAGIVSILFQLQFYSTPFNLRIVIGMSIILVGVGIAKIIRYRIAMKNDQEARRVNIEQHDERTLLIRSRAGNRAFWVSTGMICLCLFWVSFSSNGSLPVMTEDALWYSLSACVVIPFGVYITSLLIDERKL